MSAPIHPTRARLIDTVATLLDEKPPSGITSEEVLAVSGISRSTAEFRIVHAGMDVLE